MVLCQPPMAPHLAPRRLQGVSGSTGPSGAPRRLRRARPADVFEPGHNAVVRAGDLSSRGQHEVARPSGLTVAADNALSCRCEEARANRLNYFSFVHSKLPDVEASIS